MHGFISKIGEMEKKFNSVNREYLHKIFGALLLVGMINFAFSTQPVRALEIIYIREDGTIDPITAEIRRDGDLYRFTGNVSGSIWIERSDVIMDGNGFTLECPEGFDDLSGIIAGDNVTIRNVRIKGFTYAISLGSNGRVHENVIYNNFCGIRLYGSSNNLIYGNNISNNFRGVEIRSSSNNVIYENNIVSNGDDVYSGWDSNNNLFYHNNFIDASVYFHDQGGIAWSKGYPDGGNYWRDQTGMNIDYTGVDLYRGSAQNEFGSDGIGDSPLEKDEVIDLYPLMSPWPISNFNYGSDR